MFHSLIHLFIYLKKVKYFLHYPILCQFLICKKEQLFLRLNQKKNFVIKNKFQTFSFGRPISVNFKFFFNFNFFFN